jgi:hypothetical protein
MRPWTRDHTKEWIAQLENRIEDIDYYLNQAIAWCEERGIYDDQIVFACASMTVIWVSHMRNEPISKREMYELIGIKDWYKVEDLEYSLGPQWDGYDLEALLEEVVNKF